MNTIVMNQKNTTSLFKRISTYLVTACTLLLTVNVMAQESRLINTEFVSLPNQGVELRMEFDTPPSTPNSYMIESPPRFVMDFNGVTNSLGQRNLSVNTGVVDSVNFAQAQDRLRVVTNLLGTASSDVRMEGNVLVMRFQESAAVAAPSRATPVSAPVQQVADGRTQIQSIDFQRIEGNQGRVIINMNNDRASMNINREGGNVVLNLSDASLESSLAKRLDVQDFATPLSFIDSMASGRGVTVLMRPTSEPFDYMAYQTGNQLIIDFKPMTSAELQAQRDNQFPFTGERIDLNFQNVEVRAVLQIIAEVAEMNLVVSDNVRGATTLRLKNVPWDQALDILLKSEGLDKREVGNVLMVGTATEIAERERIEAESQIQVQELAPLLTEFIQVDFRRASDMRERLEGARLISDRGFILADDQTNVLMIRETARQMEEIRRTLRRFDVQVAQVLVEARLVTASTEFARELGVRWGAAGSANTRVSVGGGAGVTPGIQGVAGTGIGATLSGAQPAVPGMVDFGVGGATSAIRIGYLSSGLLLSAELSALQSDNKIEIVSQPKVITTNGMPALIKSGQEVSYSTSSTDGTNVEFKEVVLSLEVTPQINPGDRISLDLKVIQDSLDPNRFGDELLINTNQLETTVVVNDGETIVLGGVFRNDTSSETRKTPILGDLPVLGGLFRYRAENERKRELLIFITPTMIRESLAIQ
ncbi:type IV pilus secretin PilQ [Nitrincola schmidtii]|uniref:type IV pilus secretin PilQ n=1 Tax=Nitrincola schmidtii TaxID=1730894 RepID=UPI001F0EA7E1|nr:type IV pilus secretin PilQ [Nitrincola schmidtii]